jgi:hypothetical protein
MTIILTVQMIFESVGFSHQTPYYNLLFTIYFSLPFIPYAYTAAYRLHLKQESGGAR